RLEAVLMHEAAHIHRRDSMSQLLSMIVCALYWPNPLVWMAARMLRAEAEMAADDTVLASGFRPSSYAGELLQLASEFRSREPALVGMPLFMAGSALEARVKSVLAPTHRRSGVTKMDVLRICGVALLATSALVFARPTFAQDEPPPAVESAPLPPPAPAETPAPPPAPKPVVSRVTRAGNSAPPAPVAAAVAISAAPADSATPPEPPTPALPAPAPLPATAAAPAPVPADAIDSPYPAVRVREAVRMVHGHQIRRIWIDTHDAQRAAEDAMRRVQPKLERAMREMQRVQPELARAQAEMQAREAELRALQTEQPRIQAQVEAALERVRPEIEKAVAEARLQHMDVKVHEHVDSAMKNAEIRIVIKKRGDAQAKPGEQDDNAPDQN
ncbi:MAG TPA: M56 family metallopeptidase, partial [Rhizomicrobium sp.]|nr:M56 family metallopeptidase [Rhizomicrobium sp.]